jgi:hypothetical protein
MDYDNWREKIMYFIKRKIPWRALRTWHYRPRKWKARVRLVKYLGKS